MISLTRDRTDKVVHHNFKGSKRVELNLKLLTKKKKGELEEASKDKWDSSIWKEAKIQLLIESNNKCAYCETPTRVVQYGDVEHFRPKSQYWWLAYSYENYLVSCAVCNQEYKKDKFDILNEHKKMVGPKVLAKSTTAFLKEIAPLMTVDPVNDKEGMGLKKFIKEVNNEYALIINPYYEDPSLYLAYKVVLENREIVVVPTKAQYQNIVTACEEIFGINRQELMDLRFQWYCLYMTYRHTLADKSISTNTRLMNQKRIKEMVSDFSAYAGMIRYFEAQKLSSLPWDFNISVSGQLARTTASN